MANTRSRAPGAACGGSQTSTPGVRRIRACRAAGAKTAGAASFVMLSEEDVHALRPGQPLTDGLWRLFLDEELPRLLLEEHDGSLDVLRRCKVVPPHVCRAWAAATDTGLPPELPAVPGGEYCGADYIVIPLVEPAPAGAGVVFASVLLACAEGKVLLHFDSQRGAVVEQCCLRGHLGMDAAARQLLVALGGHAYADAAGWPLKSVKVPLQTRAGDSGVFACTTILYLLAGLPPLLTPAAADVLAGYRDTYIELFHGSPFCYHGFMTREWYPAETAAALRRHLAAVVRQRVADDARLCGTLDDVEKDLGEALGKRQVRPVGGGGGK